MDVNFTVRFPSEKWHYTMYYTHRKSGTLMKKKINDNVSDAIF